MTDATRRGIRTVLDALLAILAAGVVEEFVVNLSATQRAVLVLAMVGAITTVKNALEDSGKIPALLKAPASDGDNPVPDA